MQQSTRLNLRLNGLIDIRHRDLTAAGLERGGQQLWTREGQVVAFQQGDRKMDDLLCRGMQPGLLLCDGRIER